MESLSPENITRLRIAISLTDEIVATGKSVELTFNQIDYKDTQFLRRFMSPHAKILSSNKTGTCSKHQRMVSTALKRARHMALLPFVST